MDNIHDPYMIQYGHWGDPWIIYHISIIFGSYMWIIYVDHIWSDHMYDPIYDSIYDPNIWIIYGSYMDHMEYMIQNDQIRSNMITGEVSGCIYIIYRSYLHQIYDPIYDPWRCLWIVYGSYIHFDITFFVNQMINNYTKMSLNWIIIHNFESLQIILATCTRYDCSLISLQHKIDNF